MQLIAVDKPDTFTATDDPMIEAVRQMLGVMAQLEKAMTVAKLKGARDRASTAAGRRVEGRKGYRETNPELVREVKRLARRSPKTGMTRSLREIADELARLGFTTAGGRSVLGGAGAAVGYGANIKEAGSKDPAPPSQHRKEVAYGHGQVAERQNQVR